jgi:hypothetical protein
VSGPARGIRAGLLAAWGVLAACSSRSSSPPSPTLHTLRLPAENVPLPDLPGRAKVASACAVCHSPRYVLEQPPLPRKTWEAEVDKMRKTYGAPVPDEDVAAIVDYLVAVRGG